MLKRSAALLLVLVAALLVTACGDDGGSGGSSGSDGDTTATTADDSGSSDSSSGGQTLTVTNDGNNLKFKETELTAKAGKVTIEFKNSSSIQHNIGIKDADGKKMGDEGELVGADETSTTTADLKAGTYEFYCSPHESSGMKGTLTVS
ncbi:MAG: blue (type 1) copper domain protein [Thermoleophilia bacterium]|nr:blue (type 1) copper domain protein [Thermoleophilia bacterium]